MNNQALIQNYLEYYNHSQQSKKMRSSSLNYFFNSEHFNFQNNILDITTIQLKDYFVWLKEQNISLTTKKNKWIILKSFIESLKEDYPNFTVAFPKRNINWGKEHIRAKSNKDVFMTRNEVKQLLDYFKTHNYKLYLAFRLLAETGMRQGGIVNALYQDINVEKRLTEVFEKNNQEFPNVYYFSQNYAIHLEMYLNQRKSMKVSSKNLFLTNRLDGYSLDRLNKILHNVCKILRISKNITCHTFRRTLNNLRNELGCDNMNQKILLNHKINDVNYTSYTQKDYEKFIKLYDKWNPYKNIF
jgi:integrase